MSHSPPDPGAVPLVTSKGAGAFPLGAPGKQPIHLTLMASRYSPLADQTAAELQAKAAELRRMAGTATTIAVRTSLLALADRYTVLAEQRLNSECFTSSPGQRSAR